MDGREWAGVNTPSAFLDKGQCWRVETGHGRQTSELRETGTRMFGMERDKERQRFYLLAGMGGRAARRKQRAILQWAIAAGLLASVLTAVLLYVFNRLAH